MTQKITSRPDHANSIEEERGEPPSVEYNLFFDELQITLNSLVGDTLNLSGFSYTVATVPSASDHPNGLIFITNGSSNRRLALSNGTDWRFPDGDIIS